MGLGAGGVMVCVDLGLGSGQMGLGCLWTVAPRGIAAAALIQALSTAH